MGAFGFFTPLTLLTCLSYDLIMMLKAPFASKEARFKWYLLYSYTITGFLAIFGTIFTPNDSTYASNITMRTVTNLSILAFAILAPISCIYAACVLSRPGI